MNDDFEEDVQLARVYLAGFIQTDKRGLPKTARYKTGSREEIECREAMARVLRTDRPLNRQLCEMLADMFDASENPRSPWPGLELRIARRKSHRPRDNHRISAISYFVWERVKRGDGTEQAVAEAMQKFDLSRERVYQTWKLHKRHYETVFGKPPRKAFKSV